MRKPKKAPVAEPGPVSAPAQWHRRLAAVTGELSLAVVRRKITRADLIKWAEVLRSISGEIDAFASRPR